MIRLLIGTFAAFAAISLTADTAPTVVVQKTGVARIMVSVGTAENTPTAKAFTSSLKRNLARSGYFQLGANAQIKITGTPGAVVTAVGATKQVKTSTTFANEQEARMAARAFSDAIVQTFTGKKGFASAQIAFASRKGRDDGELYTCYPDGYDILQLTHNRHAVVGPRWAPNKKDIYYTGFLQKTPLVYRKTAGSTRPSTLLAQFKGLATGAAIAPDGHRCAIILSFQGNPELYIYDMAARTINRMTRTKAASEASPCWNAAGSKMVYVSDQSRQPQIYLLDVASKKSTRITNTGSQNTHPDWSADGRMVYASKRGGSNVLVIMDPLKGESTARVVTKPGTWEHPSWAPDGRHVIAECDKALYIVDTDPEAVAAGEAPQRLFTLAGHWMNPDWAK